MLKQYVIIPKELRMSPGKIASQVAHATFMALESEDPQRIQEWKHGGMCVIVLECDTVQRLRDAREYLNTWNIINHFYIDEGMTEVPAMTPTALATGILDVPKQELLQKIEMFSTIPPLPWYKKISKIPREVWVILMSTSGIFFAVATTFWISSIPDEYIHDESIFIIQTLLMVFWLIVLLIAIKLNLNAIKNSHNEGYSG